jgi:hypothetical protein
MWLWIIIALVCLLLLIVLLLCIPLDLIFSITINESPTYKIRLLWFFGWIDRELRKNEDASKKKKITTKATQKPKRRICASTVYRILRTRGLWTQFRRLVVGIFKSLNIKELTGHLKIGLENPADTGFFYAVAAPINFLLSLLPYSIKIYPTFDSDMVFEAHAQGITRLHPIVVIFTMLKFLFSTPAMNATRTFLVNRWKRV